MVKVPDPVTHPLVELRPYSPHMDHMGRGAENELHPVPLRPDQDMDGSQREVPDQFHSATSGRSVPCSRTHEWCRVRTSSIA
jgi:hypothetical protein